MSCSIVRLVAPAALAMFARVAGLVWAKARRPKEPMLTIAPAQPGTLGGSLLQHSSRSAISSLAGQANDPL
jgi:hypothetical protein